MSAALSVEKSHSVEPEPRGFPAVTAPVSATPDRSRPLNEPAPDDGNRSLRRDRLCLWIWVVCAAILVLYHFQDLFRWFVH
jgi:hypothetical protein